MTKRTRMSFSNLFIPSAPVDPILSYLYQLFLSMDTNFRLKGRHRETTFQDVVLSPGWSYFVETNAYLAYVKRFANQEEVRDTSVVVSSREFNVLCRSVRALDSRHYISPT